MQQSGLRLSTADRVAATAVRAKGVCSVREEIGRASCRERVSYSV